MGKQNHSEPRRHLFYLNILGKLMTIRDASKDKDFQKCRWHILNIQNIQFALPLGSKSFHHSEIKLEFVSVTKQIFLNCWKSLRVCYSIKKIIFQNQLELFVI